MILTQVPDVSNTQNIEDFWRMIFLENVVSIVIAIIPLESFVTLQLIFPLLNGTFSNHGKMFLNNKKVETTVAMTSYQLETLLEGCSNSLFTTVFHLHNWKQKKELDRVEDLVATVEKVLKTNENTVFKSMNGIGRAGTMLELFTAMLQVQKGKEVNPKEIESRKMRVGRRAPQPPGGRHHHHQHPYLPQQQQQDGWMYCETVMRCSGPVTITDRYYHPYDAPRAHGRFGPPLPHHRHHLRRGYHDQDPICCNFRGPHNDSLRGGRRRQVVRQRSPAARGGRPNHHGVPGRHCDENGAAGPERRRFGDEAENEGDAPAQQERVEGAGQQDDDDQLANPVSPARSDSYGSLDDASIAENREEDEDAQKIARDGGRDSPVSPRSPFSPVFKFGGHARVEQEGGAPDDEEEEVDEVAETPAPPRSRQVPVVAGNLYGVHRVFTIVAPRQMEQEEIEATALRALQPTPGVPVNPVFVMMLSSQKCHRRALAYVDSTFRINVGQWTHWSSARSILKTREAAHVYIFAVRIQDARDLPFNEDFNPWKVVFGASSLGSGHPIVLHGLARKEMLHPALLATRGQFAANRGEKYDADWNLAIANRQDLTRASGSRDTRRKLR